MVLKTMVLKPSKKTFKKMIKKVKSLIKKKQTKKTNQKNKPKKSTILKVDKIKNYKGLWRPETRNIYTMSRRGIINDLKNFRDAWEDNLGIHQDLSDELINFESTDDLLDRLEWYYSDECKQSVESNLGLKF